MLTGVINTSDLERLNRMVFRASRGNALTMLYDIEKPMRDIRSGDMTEKSVFIILYKSGDSDALRRKLERIVETNGARHIEVNPDPEFLASAKA
jgi:hypothetical protein